MSVPKMNYCMQCGTKLVTRHLDLEGDVLYCEKCGAVNSGFRSSIPRSAWS